MSAGGQELIRLLADVGPVRSAARRAIARELSMGSGVCRDRAETLSGRLLDVAAQAAAGALDASSSA